MALCASRRHRRAVSNVLVINGRPFARNRPEARMSLKGTYAYSVDMAQKLGLQGSIEERDGKLHFKGTVPTQADANKIWDAIKTIPTWSQDVVADIQASGGDAARTYT